jgi:hypothetical protein
MPPHLGGIFYWAKTVFAENFFKAWKSFLKNGFLESSKTLFVISVFPPP